MISSKSTSSPLNRDALQSVFTKKDISGHKKNKRREKKEKKKEAKKKEYSPQCP
jgi:hypothetical protein